MSAQRHEHVTVQLLGPLTAVVAGRRLSGRALGSRKARTVLGLLASSSGRTSADRLVEAAWPDRLPARPAAELAILVSRLRSVLGTATITGGRAGYQLDRTWVTTDCDEAERLVDEAEGRRSEPALAVAAATGALALLDRGDVVEDEPDADWADQLRGQLAALRRRARLAVAAGCLATGEPDVARRAAEQVLADDPLDEEACRLLMRAARALGEDSAALTAYEQLRVALVDAVGGDPSSATREVHLAVLRGTEIDDPSRPVRSAVPQSQLVGREPELALLADAWRRTLATGCTLLLITGEPGIGKTSLAGQVSDVSAGALVLSARCWEAERSLFLQPLVEAVGAVVAGLPRQVLADVVVTHAEVLAALVPEVAALRPTAPVAVTASPDAGRRATYDAVAGFLRRLSRHRPLVLVVDDLHNAGLATVDLLHYLVRTLRDSPLMIVATLRADEGSAAVERLAPVAELLPLSPLDEAAVSALVSAAGQAQRLREILTSTSGHPLFVVETLRGLASGQGDLSATLQDSVLARVSRLGRDAEALLRAAAVLGSTFEPADLAALTATSPAAVTRACEDLLATRMLTVDGRAYAFVYDIAREVLYRTTPEPSRLTHHARAADLMADRPEAMAGHAAAAGDLPRAALAWLQAGGVALRRFAAADAEALLDKAIAVLEAVDAPDLSGRCHLERGRTREAQMSWPGAIEDYRAAEELGRVSGDQRLQMTALWQLGWDSLAASGAPLASSTDHVARAGKIARALGDRGFEARVLSRLAVLACNDLDFASGLLLAQQAHALGRDSGDADALTAGLDGLKTVYAYTAEVAALAPVLDELLPRMRRQQDVVPLQWALFESSFLPLAEGDWAEASRRVEEALAYSRSRGSSAYEAWFLAHLGWFARLQGRAEDALAHGLRSVDVGRRAEPVHVWCRAVAVVMYATTLLRSGRRDEAAEVLLANVDAVPDGLARAYRARFAAALAEATGVPAHLAEAEALLQSVTTPGGSAWLLGWDSYVSVAEAHLANGDDELAAATVAPLVDAALRVGWAPVLQDAQSSAAKRSAARCAPWVSTGR